MRFGVVCMLELGLTRYVVPQYRILRVISLTHSDDSLQDGNPVDQTFDHPHNALLVVSISEIPI